MKNLIIVILVAVQIGLTVQIIRVQRDTEAAKQETEKVWSVYNVCLDEQATAGRK